MDKRYSGRIILTGFSYTGKTHVAHIVAARLGWDAVDTDEEIVRLAGKPVGRIFADDGEDQFRNLERQALKVVCQNDRAVISTGGGVIMSAENRELIKRAGMVICLEAQPETIYQRLTTDSANPDETAFRPLLAEQDPLGKIAALKESRQYCYAQSDWTVHTDTLTPEEVADEVIRAWLYLARNESRWETDRQSTSVITMRTQSYPIRIGQGVLDSVGQQMSGAGLRGYAYIISDDQVFPLYGERVKASLEDAGFDVDSLIVPHGEPSKSIAVAMRIYDFLVLHRAERSHSIVALGGGVVGDLAGYVAATYVRGMPLVQIPTSLMAMVDSSIGGKVAINHPEGKNLIGSFYQPHVVISDIGVLKTLPKRELTSGWAEVIKHGLIRDESYVQFLRKNASDLMDLKEEVLTEAIRRSAAIKASVVTSDEQESGLRTILNYGHTIAHGLEKATGYERMLHGEAVSIGMTGAARIAREIGLLDEDTVARQEAILGTYGLPVRCSGLDPDAVMRAIELDKKTQMKSIRWVLLSQIGRPVIRNDIPTDIVRQVVSNLIDG